VVSNCIALFFWRQKVMTAKTCTSCKIQKPTNQFHNDNSRIDKKNIYCIECQNQINRDHYQQKKDGYYKTPQRKQSMSESTKRQKIQKRGQGLCVQCGKNRPKDRKSKCSECFNKSLELQRLQRIKAIENKQCSRCFKLPVISEYSYCEICFFKYRAYEHLKDRTKWHTLKEKLESQNYKCVYTNQILVVGKNATIDHILPKSRCPELRYTLSNLQWVTLTANQMKKDLTHEEFLEHISQIYHHVNNRPSWHFPTLASKIKTLFFRVLNQFR
jgi:hypothetical protein